MSNVILKRKTTRNIHSIKQLNGRRLAKFQRKYLSRRVLYLISANCSRHAVS